MSNNVFDFSDFEGKEVQNTMFGEITTGERRDDITVQFQYSLSGFDLENPSGTLTGTGAVNHVTNKASIESGTGVGTAKLVTKDKIRYRPGHECVVMFTADFTTGEVNTFQHHGIFNGSDGFYFGVEDTQFGIFRLNGGVETFTAQADWDNPKEDKFDGNGDSGFDLDETKYNFYKISYGWFGIAPIFFSVYTGHETGWRLCHVIDLVNSQDEPHIENPSLPISMEVGRTSGTGANITLLTSSVRAATVGESDEDNNSNRRFGEFAANITVAASTITHLISLKSKATYQTKNNHVKTVVEILVSTNSGNKDVVFKAYSPSQVTLSTPLVYSDKNTAESVMQTSQTAATITELSEPNDIAIVLRNNFRVNTNVQGFVLYADDETIFAVDAPAGGGGDMSLQINWREEF